MNAKLRGIIHLKVKVASLTDDLRNYLVSEAVQYDDARSCAKLFGMFLINSGNFLLAEILKRGNKLGPNAKGAALASFQSIW